MNVQAITATSMFGLDPNDPLNDLRMSDKAMPLYTHVKRFIAETVRPMSEEYYRLGEGNPDRWQFAPGQLDVPEVAKNKAKAEGLWNFFLPDAETGEGLSNLDYAYIAVELGKSPLASETMNCAGAGHGQYGSARTGRDARTKGTVVEAAPERRNPLRLCHDRA